MGWAGLLAEMERWQTGTVLRMVRFLTMHVEEASFVSLNEPTLCDYNLGEKGPLLVGEEPPAALLFPDSKNPD